MVDSQQISDQLYTSVSKIVTEHGSTVDVSVIVDAFDSFTNKVNYVNSLLQQRVDSWEKCLTVDETGNNNSEYFNNNVAENIKTPYFYSLISTNYFPIIGIDLVLIGAADLLRGHLHHVCCGV